MRTAKTNCSKNRCKIKVLPQRLIMIMLYTTLTMKEKSWFFLFVPKRKSRRRKRPWFCHFDKMYKTIL